MTLFEPEQKPAKPMVLRPYQHAAVEAVYRHLREQEDNPCVVIPTGGGKTPVIATMCKDAVTRWSGRVLILAHVKELLEQAHDKLCAVCPEMDVGVYSAGLGRRDKHHNVIIAGIQSVYEKASELGPFDLVIVDEAHMIPMDGDGMYRRFLEDARKISPHLRVIGLTATPFRLSSGPICTKPPEGILNSICYEIGVRELILDGYLAPLRSKAGKIKANTSDLHVRAGEFVASEVEAAMDQEMIVHSACREIVDLTADRKACLIFASSVKHGQHVAEVLEKTAHQECGFIDGQTPSIFRDQLIRRFRDGDLKYLANVNVLTTGFDAPNVDCIALLRPTMSPGLYYQMVGRGFRICPGKADCLVLDYGGNVLRHGPVDQLRVKAPGEKGGGEAPAKECPQCHELIATGYARCPACGYEFPRPNYQQLDGAASARGVLAGQVCVDEYAVRSVRYSVHTKRNAGPGDPPSLRVDYEIGFYKYKSEWICIEHTGYARQKAEEWWARRSRVPVPSTVEEALHLAQAGALAEVKAITLRSVAGEKYDRIVDYQLGKIPDPEALRIARDTIGIEQTPGSDGEWDRNSPEPEPAIAEDDIPF